MSGGDASGGGRGLDTMAGQDTARRQGLNERWPDQPAGLAQPRSRSHMSNRGGPAMLPPEIGGQWAQVMRTMAVCAVLWLGAGLANAGPAEDCNQLRNLDLQLRGCTAYIRLGKG